jgi:hypothetical protein
VSVLLLALFGITGCDKKMDTLSADSPNEPDLSQKVIIPDDPLLNEGDIELVEIKDFRTKLYFYIECPSRVQFPLITYPKGILYTPWKEVKFTIPALSFFDLISYHPDPEVDYSYSDYHLNISNFPDYALKWNPKEEPKRNMGICVEGELDVIISGIIHVTGIQKSPYYAVASHLELTSLTLSNE